MTERDRYYLTVSLGFLFLSFLIAVLIYFSISVGWAFAKDANITDLGEENISAADDYVNYTSTSSKNLFIDEKGIPLVNNSKYGLQRNPVTIARYADHYYEQFSDTNDTQKREYFLNTVDWLTKNAVLGVSGNISFATYDYKVPLPKFNLTPPWISAMAHGKAVPAFYKAYEMTGDQRYLNMTSLVLNSFYITADDGGATIKSLNNTGWWYEEVTGPGAVQGGSRILNGMVYALLGIYDYYNQTGDPAAKYIFDQGVLAVRNQLPNYDFQNETMTWSYYDIYPRQVAPLKYHKVHVDLMNQLYQITGDQVFKTYHDRWLAALQKGEEALDSDSGK